MDNILEVKEIVSEIREDSRCMHAWLCEKQSTSTEPLDYRFFEWYFYRLNKSLGKLEDVL